MPTPLTFNISDHRSFSFDRPVNHRHSISVGHQYSRRIPVLFAPALCTLALIATGCLEHPVKAIKVKRDTPLSEYRALKNNRDVDILFVIDNSGSMGEEQRALSRNFASFVEVLDAPSLRANYRLGVTTTDSGTMMTKGCRAPDNGELRLQSCKERADEFIDQARTTSRFNTACNSVCNLEAQQLQIRPSAIDETNTLAPRSWLEKINGETNLEDRTTSIADAFGCYGPQGIDGCGYEAQLESMYQALEKSEDPNQPSKNPNYGFLRDDAILAVVHVSDELDCSVNPSHPLKNQDPEKFEAGLFGRESNAFWGPGQDYANSANCLHAGVSCSGLDGDNYESCVAQNKSMAAKTLASDEDQNLAVLTPVERYIQGVQAIADQKSSDGKGEVIVGLIGGVNEDGSISYPRSDSGAVRDEFLKLNFGIGAGCRSETSFLEEKDPEVDSTIPAGTEIGIALPPVRLAKFASAFAAEDEQFAYRICQDDLTGPLKRIAKSIAGKIEPSCYYGCVKDAKPELAAMVPDCTVAILDPSGGDFDRLPECERQNPEDPSSPYVVNHESGAYQIPAGQDLCYAARTDFDGQQTQDPNDNLAAVCRASKQNVEFFVEYRSGYRAPKNKQLMVNCALSENAALDCKHL